jgi:hypothetical protein
MPQPNHPERRVRARHRYESAALVEAAWPCGLEPVLVWVLNLTAGGAGLALGRPLEAGTLLLLQLRRPSPGGHWQLPARVAWSAWREGVWYAGCEFLDGLSAEQFEDLLRGMA